MAKLIGNKPNQIPSNGDLGTAAFIDVEQLPVSNPTQDVLDLKAPIADPTFTGDITVGDGIYLGGTGAANYLDDYEEGTWTPDISGASTAGSASYNDRVASYTKIGNLVNVSFYINGTFTSTPSGVVQISGLPFTPTSNANGLGYPSTKGAIGYASPGYNGALYMYAESSNNKLYFGITRDNASLSGVNFSTHLSNSSFQVHIELTYRTS